LLPSRSKVPLVSLQHFTISCPSRYLPVAFGHGEDPPSAGNHADPDIGLDASGICRRARWHFAATPASSHLPLRNRCAHGRPDCKDSSRATRPPLAYAVTLRGHSARFRYGASAVASYLRIRFAVQRPPARHVTCSVPVGQTLHESRRALDQRRHRHVLATASLIRKRATQAGGSGDDERICTPQGMSRSRRQAIRQNRGAARLAGPAEACVAGARRNGSLSGCVGFMSFGASTFHEKRCKSATGATTRIGAIVRRRRSGTSGQSALSRDREARPNKAQTDLQSPRSPVSEFPRPYSACSGQRAVGIKIGFVSPESFAIRDSADTRLPPE